MKVAFSSFTEKLVVTHDTGIIGLNVTECSIESQCTPQFCVDIETCRCLVRSQSSATEISGEENNFAFAFRDTELSFDVFTECPRVLKQGN